MDSSTAKTERLFNRLCANTLELNRAHLRDERDELIKRGCGAKTMEYYLYGLGIFAGMFKDTDMGALNELEIAKALNGLRDLHYSDYTVQHIRRCVKMFYKRLNGSDFVKFIKLYKAESSITADSLYTHEDLRLLCSATKTLRDKTIIAVLYDSAARRDELLGLRIKDINLEHRPTHITVYGKTGKRTIPLTFSTELLQQHIANTPRLNGSVECRLWDINAAGLRKMLTTVRKRSGVQKRVFPQLFRISRLTELFSIWPEQVVKKFAGWTPGSRMPEIYCKLLTKPVDEAAMRTAAICEDIV